MALIGWDSEKYEVFGGLLDMCFPDDLRGSSEPPESSKYKMSINGTTNCFPKHVIIDVIRDRMEEPLRSRQMWKELLAKRLVTGPHFTSRLENKVKKNYRLFWVNNNKILEEQQKLGEQLDG